MKSLKCKYLVMVLVCCVSFASSAYASLTAQEKAAVIQIIFQSVMDPDPNADYDADGLTNQEEEQYGTNLYSADTDNDGLPDLWEVTDPEGLGLTH